jgi:hypothetical protein
VAMAHRLSTARAELDGLDDADRRQGEAEHHPPVRDGERVVRSTVWRNGVCVDEPRRPQWVAFAAISAAGPGPATLAT